VLLTTDAPCQDRGRGVGGRVPAPGLGEARDDCGAAEVDGVVHRRGVGVRQRCETRTDAARDERKLDGAETVVERAELDEALPGTGAAEQLVD
jgi:hypothetical protein